MHKYICIRIYYMYIRYNRYIYSTYTDIYIYIYTDSTKLISYYSDIYIQTFIVCTIHINT